MADIVNETTNILNEKSSYNDIYKLLVDTNIEKINLIKNKMNTYVDTLDYENTYNILPINIDYILHLITKSFPILNKYHKQIIPILLLINSINIHPSIYQSLLPNILYSVYIIELSNNPEYKKSKEFLNSIGNIYNEIEIIMSIFNNIFTSIDTEYKDKESFLLYGIVGVLSNSEIDNLSESISDDTKLDDKILNLSVMINKIEKLTHCNMNEFFINMEDDYDCLNKLEYDLILHDKIIKEFNENIVNNYKYMSKFINYKNINNIDILQFTNKNVIYYWIDYIAIINGKIIDKILK